MLEPSYHAAWRGAYARKRIIVDRERWEQQKRNCLIFLLPKSTHFRKNSKAESRILPSVVRASFVCFWFVLVAKNCTFAFFFHTSHRCSIDHDSPFPMTTPQSPLFPHHLEAQSAHLPAHLPFARYAHVSDLQHKFWQASRAEIEPFARDFGALFEFWGTPDYIWPPYPLYAWSRIWEYPFVHRIIAGIPKKSTILDIGSATTFLPFYLANQYSSTVAGIDPDPYHLHHFTACAHEVQKRLAVKHLPLPVQTRGDALPYPDAFFDIAYSVSVIEHIPDPLPTMREMVRVLKPGGTLILTLDVNYPFGTQAGGLSQSALQALLQTLSKELGIEIPLPEAPLADDVLLLHNSPMRNFSIPKIPASYYLRQPKAAQNLVLSKLRKIVGNAPRSESAENLAVVAIVVQKP
ncbi:MAG: class I SAM-dependent methyltransferase [Candidatus Kapaibacterium sp.]|nr:MAG: class I SAM-dependent methyltransferase [Candidatus Kapabacteria bacterium]